MRAPVPALAATLLLLASACGGGHSAAPATPSATATPAPPPAATQTAVPPAPATSPAPTPRRQRAVAPAGRCTAGQVTAALHESGPAAGNRYAVLVLTATASCHMSGYPGLQLVSAAGAALPTRTVRLDLLIAGLSLTPGQSAWTQLRWSVVPAGAEPATGPCEPAPAALQVIPPGDTAHVTTAWALGPVCNDGSIQVTPFAAGTGPSAG